MGKIIKRGILVLLILIAAITIWILITLGKVGMGPCKFLLYNKKPVLLSEQKFAIAEKEFSCVVNGEKISGTIYIPEDERRSREILIISPGFNSTEAMLASKAKSFAISGTPAVVFDFRGGSSSGKSEGDSTNMSISTEMSDLNAVIGYVQGLEWVNKEKIYLLGESMGGLVSALTAAEHKDIAGLVLCFPALDKAESTRKTFSNMDKIPDTINMFGLLTGKKLWQELYEMDVYEKIKKYTGPVIIMHGTKDPAVDLSYSEKANNVYTNSQLFVVEGAGHGFNGDDEKSVLKTIYAFIHKQ
ncbi:alpha/beta hydrolase [Clostridium cellulovorans]|uniref:Alpha/beta superfamily hydrolase n=2 Tax=Clostridium cellulovorans TaxID=1493 RepID=D9SNU3_CLOC7|nr:alpha/beta hydrolase [Clostridium cellulovorans]ADL49964.1 alpha/beta superfamily hydrolase [Clostridium cellulovorans 743B]BAV13192.1 alpha/beta superfamily hydrolase [Clostridium cellulovorans]